MIKRRIDFLVIVALLLFACTPRGEIPQPRSVAEGIAQAHVVLQEVTTSVDRLVTIQAVKGEDALRMLAGLEDAEQRLTQARVFLSVGDATNAQTQLDLAETLILALRAEAAARGGGT